MTVALGLVAASVFCHATWNLMAKRAAVSGTVFVALWSVVAAVIWARPWVSGRSHTPEFEPKGVVVHRGCALVLQRGYAIGDLSVVYPVARGLGPVLTCLVAVPLFGEDPGLFGWAGTFALAIRGGFCGPWTTRDLPDLEPSIVDPSRAYELTTPPAGDKRPAHADGPAHAARRARARRTPARLRDSAPVTPYAAPMRKTIAVVSLVLAAVLSIPAVVLLWVQRDIVNADQFTATSRGLIAEPRVQTEIADRVTTAVVQRLQIPNLVDSAADQLPPRLGELLHKIEPALDSAVTDYVNHAAVTLVGSDQFVTIWDRVNHLAHQAVLKVLQGQGDSVTLDLGPVVQEVKTRLVNDGFSLAAGIPDIHPEYTLATSPKVAKARNMYSAFEVLRWLIPVLALVLLGVGIVLARDRWRAVVWGATGIALAMAVAGAATWIVRARLGTGQAVYDAFIASLHSMLRWVFLIAVVAAGVAYLIGYPRRRSSGVG